MTGRDGDAPAQGAAADSWLACAPELAAAGFLVLATSVAAYVYAGLGTAILTVAGWAVISLAFLPMLIPAAAQPLIEQALWHSQARTSFLGFWRKRSTLRDATISMPAYDLELRPVLQHLLAARLAERHGVSLYGDPAAARRLLLPGGRDDALWFWLDPARPPETETDQRRRGIPPRTLSAIIERLERL